MNATATVSVETGQSTTRTVSIESSTDWTPNKGVVGMTCLIIAESAIFTIFVIAYLYYLGKDLSGPTPRQVLELPILNSICLLSSSATITFALRSLRNDDSKRFRLWWLATIALGAYFLLGTGREWYHLIHDKGLTIQTNLFGTTFYSLVGLHASHVIVGLLALSIVMAFAIAGLVKKEQAERVHVLGLYWHFVDVVWIVVFTVVYIIGRCPQKIPMNANSEPTAGKPIEVPAATGWPLVAAFGFTLVFAGLLTHVMVSTLGAITLCMGLAGWFCQVLPREAHESVRSEEEELVLAPRESKVRHLEVGELGHRARLPLEIYPYSAGVRGGLVGGAVMAVLAILY